MSARCWLAAALFCWTANLISVERVIDGDTFVADMAIWPGLVVTEHIRLLGVDTPEHKPDEIAWQRARLYTEQWLAESGYVEITGCKRDSFGRILATVRSRLKGDLGSSLLMQGLAVPYHR